jgi:hypothetical protein
MNKVVLFLFMVVLFVMLQACSTSAEEDISYASEFGYLYKDGKEFVHPFVLQKKSAKVWSDLEDAVTVLDSFVDDYFPLKRRNSPYTYRIKMNVLREYFTEEQYTVSLWAADKNRKACGGEPREFTFYRVAENADSVEYYSSTAIDSVFHGRYLFFGLREMPSYNWYHVLNVFCNRKKEFILIGEVKE